MTRVLIVEGNTAEARDRSVAAGGTVANQLYAAALRRVRGDLSLEVVFPADSGAVLPDSAALRGFDGIAWTGSSLNIYHGGPEIERQLAFCRTCFAAGVPQFGSCWGLQVGAVAAGGTVEANPLGREIGLARKIVLTGAGRVHPLYRGRPDAFDAIAVHRDIVTALPEGAQILAHNAMAHVQAAAFSRDGGVFWGVQYHPEYTFTEIAASMRRYTEGLVAEGLFDSVESARSAAQVFASFDQGGAPENRWLAGIDGDVLDPAERLRDLRNWLDFISGI
ncbi:type 1 glutamine amidotransferase [Iodidimonas sp. SYSU 1G8]|uniref:type 1 glutamine amidotransferase n=1 Tax=Iodidimonas sp. SYSU 1G8 TaxID=3133967 RepID=UPI0031FE972C